MESYNVTRQESMEEQHRPAKPSFENLPVECLSKIFEYLDISDRLRVEKVCKRWAIISIDAKLRSSQLTVILNEDTHECFLKFGRFVDQVRCRIARKQSSPVNRILENHGKHLKSVVLQGKDYMPWLAGKSEIGWKLGHVVRAVAKNCPNIEAISFVNLVVPHNVLDPFLKRNARVPSVCYHRTEIFMCGDDSVNLPRAKQPQVQALSGKSVQRYLNSSDWSCFQSPKLILTLSSENWLEPLAPFATNLRASSQKTIDLYLKMTQIQRLGDHLIIGLLNHGAECLETLCMQFRTVSLREAGRLSALFSALCSTGNCIILKKFFLCGTGEILTNDRLKCLSRWMSRQKALKDVYLGCLNAVTDITPLSSLSHIEKLSLCDAVHLAGPQVLNVLDVATNITHLHLLRCRCIDAGKVFELLAYCKTLVALETRDCCRYQSSFFHGLASLELDNHRLQFIRLSNYVQILPNVLQELRRKFALVAFYGNRCCRIVIKNEETWINTKTIRPHHFRCLLCDRE